MKTASFFTYTGPGRISIARYAPRGTPKGFRIFKALAPGPWFNSVSKEEYIERFENEILRPLDPVRVFKQLVALAGEAEPVLLCWEKPPLDGLDGPGDNFCHRRLVARWFEQFMPIEVPELEPQASRRKDPEPSAQLSIEERIEAAVARAERRLSGG